MPEPQPEPQRTSIIWDIAKGMVIYLLYYYIYRYFAGSNSGGATTTIKTPSGVIEGHVVHAPSGGAVVEFLGIPYAKPPVGQLRYQDPVEYGKLTGRKYSACCMKSSCVMQPDSGEHEGNKMWTPTNPQSEDCLYLNLWVPAGASTTAGKRLTTMVWIYGGGYYSGSSALSIYNATILADYTLTIVVTFNYRVGSLGFLSSGDERISGNFGLKDQYLALKWVHDNIASFGGDPKSVTVFGESSGASSIGLHMMTDKSPALFKRVILQSGAPHTHWGFMDQQQAASRAAQLFDAVGCRDDEDVLDCLQELDVHEILANEWIEPRFLKFPWVPTIDGTFLKDSPEKLLQSGMLSSDKDALLGVTCQEGSFWLANHREYLSKDFTEVKSSDDFSSLVHEMNKDLDEDLRDRIVRAYQPRDFADTRANRDNLELVAGDRSFTCPTRTFADRLHELHELHYNSQHTKQYFYTWCYRATTEVWPHWMGTIHGAEIQWIFGLPLEESNLYAEEEKELSKTMMAYWSNFAKTGNPNAAELEDWEPYSPHTHKHLHVDEEGEVITSDHKGRQVLCDMWSDIEQQRTDRHTHNTRT